jgi:hypothetical protein
MYRSRFTDYCCYAVAFTGAAGKQKAIIRHDRNHRSKLIPRRAIIVRSFRPKSGMVPGAEILPPPWPEHETIMLQNAATNEPAADQNNASKAKDLSVTVPQR